MTEYQLTENGYGLCFMGQSARFNLAEAKQKAKEKRADGYYARVLTCASGHYLFAKKKKLIDISCIDTMMESYGINNY